MVRLLAVAVLLAGLHTPAAAADAWPVPRGPSREPAPYRYDPRTVKGIPKHFIDDNAATIYYAASNYLVDADGTIECVTHEVARLNGRKGINKLGEFRNITYTPSYQKLTLNVARIHKPSGKVFDIEPRHVHLRDVSTDYQVYDPEKQLIITFPSLEVGDVIEVKWTVRGRNPEHDGQFFQKYSFGDVNYPIVRDEIRVRLPRSMPLKHAVVHGKITPAITETATHRLYHWKADLCPRPPRDEDLPSKEELRPYVMVSTFTSWEQVGAWKHKLRAECWKCTPEVREVVDAVTRGWTSPADRARVLTYWVRRNIRYVSVGERHDYTPHPPAKVLANRYGDCKDGSQLLAVMLREAGLKVELATLGILDDGQVHPDVPSPWGTHAILAVTIGERVHWIDTTARLAGWDFLPRDDLDRLCYLTDEKGKIRLLRTPRATPERTRVVQTTDVWLGNDGTSRSRRTTVSFGSAALRERDRYVEVPPGERRRQVTAQLQDSNSRSRLIALAVDERKLADHDQPVTVSVEFEIPRHFTGGAEKEGSVTDSQVWGKLLAHNIDHDRKTPMVLPAPFESLHTYRFHLPPAYAVDVLPRDRTVRSPWGNFTVRCKPLDADEVVRNVEVVFHTRLEKTRIEVDQLEEFRKFHEDINRQYRVWLGVKAVGDLAGAPYIELALAVAPQDAFAAATLARIYLQASRLADARRVLQRACHYNPDSVVLWELRVQAAETPAQEEEAHRQLIRQFPGDSGHRIGLAANLVTQGKHPEARALLGQVIAGGTATARARAHYQMARSHYRKDEMKDALAQLDLAAKADSSTVNNVRAWTLRGQVLDELKQPADAITAYRRALELDRRSQEALLTLVRLSLLVRDELAALDYLRRYTLLAARDVSGLVLAADAYLKLRRYDEAFELALRARELGFHEKAQRILGLVYLHRGDHAAAVRHLEKAEADAVVLAALIRAHIQLGRLRDLPGLLDRADRLGGSEALARLCGRGRALLKRREDLPRGVRVPAGKAAEYATAFDALALAEDAWRAREPAERVAKLLEPALRPATGLGPAFALRGRLALDRGRLARALEDGERAIARSPDDAAGYLVRGRVRLERGAIGALADLERAAKLSARSDADVLSALAEALAAAGRHSEAVTAAREAVKLRPTDRELSELVRTLEEAAKQAS